MRIACRECGAAIASRECLAVAGRTLQPMHGDCLRAYAARQPWYRRPGWPVNRWGSLLRFDAVLLAAVLLLHLLDAPALAARWPVVVGLLLAANAWLLLARGVSWLSIERHLPRA